MGENLPVDLSADMDAWIADEATQRGVEFDPGI